MPLTSDHARLFVGLAALLDAAGTRRDGPSTLRDLLNLGEQALGGHGAWFAACTPAGARVVAASRSARWALGSAIDVPHPALARLLAGPRTRECHPDDLPPPAAAQLVDRGLHRLLLARAEVSGRLVGALHVAFPDPDGRATAEQRAAVTALAAAAARLYDESASHGSVSHERPDHECGRDLFVAVLGHELRTPVTVIKGFTGTLTEHWDALDDDARRDAVRVVHQRADDLARLVDRLLCAASETDESPRAAPPVPFDLVAALRAAVDGLPAEMRSELRVDLPRSLPKALGDRASVATVLTELVTNAYKYSPAPAQMSLTARAGDRTVSFQVTDRGPGIRPEHVERAFERFWQGDTEDQRRYGGVGLGLYLVRRIVERQNGRVSLRRRELGGTVAEVRLPRADVAPGEA
ncbi:MAG: HAMP domain-containing sensor histidine kinase [Micromonosporaceae bacterium]